MESCSKGELLCSLGFNTGTVYSVKEIPLSLPSPRPFPSLTLCVSVCLISSDRCRRPLPGTIKCLHAYAPVRSTTSKCGGSVFAHSFPLLSVLYHFDPFLQIPVLFSLLTFFISLSLGTFSRFICADAPFSVLTCQTALLLFYWPSSSKNSKLAIFHFLSYK